MFSRTPSADAPGLELYAEVVLHGRVVATVDNHGQIGSDAELLQLGIDMHALSADQLPKGPDRAQVLADQLAQAVGGYARVKLDTALDQATYDRLEPPPVLVDQDDPYNLKLLKIMQARAVYQQQTAMLISSEQQAEADRTAARLEAIKAKPNRERTQEEHAFLLAHDSRMAEIAAIPNGQRTADEVDYMQKVGGFVNTMAQVRGAERALYDALVAAGDTDAVRAMNMIALTRHAVDGAIVLPNGVTFNPGLAGITADNVERFFRHCLAHPAEDDKRAFHALIVALERRESV